MRTLILLSGVSIQVNVTLTSYYPLILQEGGLLFPVGAHPVTEASNESV